MINLLSTILDLSFSVHKLEKFSSNPGKVHFEGLVNILGFIRDNDTWGLNSYFNINDAPVSELLVQASINTDNPLMGFSSSIWQDCPYTVRSTRVYIIFYKVGPIKYGTHVPGPVSQASAEISYNAECTSWMDLAHFRMLIHELLNINSYIFPEEAPIIILDSNSAMCMDNNGKYTKHKSQILRRVHFVRNVENDKMHKIDWC